MYCKVHVNAEACMVSLSGKTKRLPRIKTGPLSAHAWHPLRQKNMRPQMHSVHSIARSTMSPHGGQVTRILWGVQVGGINFVDKRYPSISGSSSFHRQIPERPPKTTYPESLGGLSPPSRGGAGGDSSSRTKDQSDLNSPIPLEKFMERNALVLHV